MRPSIIGLAMLAASLAHGAGAGPSAADEDQFTALRESMVRSQIEIRGIRDARVLQAMLAVPRHRFVPREAWDMAYADTPLPIGDDQTISQPYIVALMSELLEIEPGDRVLEIGTGSGYQAAVLAAMGAKVFTIEIVEKLGRRAEKVLDSLKYDEVTVRIGDGYLGWPEEAPFDAVIVTAAPDHVPQPLLEQLAPGGHLVIPVGRGIQKLEVYSRRLEDGYLGPSYDHREVIAVRFVPMTGKAQD